MNLLPAVFFICVVTKTFAVRINCEFRANSEECKIASLHALESDLEVTSITGRHSFRKTNNDVKEFWITKDVTTEYVPTNFCKFFPNLLRVDIYGSKIKFITRDAFKNCEKVTKVCLMFTSLTTIPENLFEGLPDLKDLQLYENNLVILPENLIAKNLKLETFIARINQLTIIDIEFPSTLTTVDLTSNNCINEKFTNNSSVTAFNERIKEKCESPVKKSFKGKISELQGQIIQKDKEIENFKSIEENLERLNLNMTQMMVNESKLKYENAERLKEIEAIKSNNKQEMTTVFDENIVLRSNLTVCQGKVADKEMEVMKFTVNATNLDRILKQLQTSNSELNENLSKAKKENDKNVVQLQLLEGQKFYLGESIEECWQNISLISELNDDLNVQILNVSAELYDTKKNCDEPVADNLHENSADGKLSTVYIIVLILAFGAIYVSTIIYMKRQASRMLIKSMINKEVSMNHLIENE